MKKKQKNITNDSDFVSTIPFAFRPYSKGGKRSVFVVNTVALVTQQTEYIRRHTDLTCGEYSGDMRVDFWSESKWMDELEKNQVKIFFK